MGKSEGAHHAVLLPALLLQHDDAVRALVEGGGQALPLRVQRLDPPLQVELALSHYCDLIPDGIKISGKAKRFKIHLRVSRWVTCSVMLVFLWFTWMMLTMMTMLRMVMKMII